MLAHTVATGSLPFTGLSTPIYALSGLAAVATGLALRFGHKVRSWFGK
jgi:hypothetical protein